MEPRSATRTLSTADERREALIEAATPIFAAEGFHAASTVAIAEAAGISQAYVFRLFPKKVDLFLACCERNRRRMLDTFRDAVDSRPEGQEPLEAMGLAYRDLLESDRDMLMIQLQSQVVSGEPRISASMRKTFRELYALVAELSGADAEEMRQFFAHGMLKNVMAAIDAFSVDESWARVLTGDEDA
jgi:AcrR family transcriptional regulator